MSGCVLRVSGSTAKVRTFLAESKLRPIRVFLRGEVDFPSRGPNKKSGFNVPLPSSGEGAILLRQSISVANFINRHRREFERLTKFGFASPVLDFALNDLATQERPWPTYHLSPKLIAVAGEFGLAIELSFYGK